MAAIKKLNGEASQSNQQVFDPLDVVPRLYKQVSLTLEQLEFSDKVTLKERIAALLAIGRIQVIFMGLRKEKSSDVAAGTAVRKYADAFKANDTRRRKKNAGPADEPDAGIDDIFKDDDDDGDDLRA
jgi:hypothetical protein